MSVDPATRLPSASINADHPAVVDFAHGVAAGRRGPEAAIALYYAVRDGFRYSPWNVIFEASAFKASAILTRDSDEAHCIDKAVVLAASCRALDIPAKLRFANVRNHIGTARLHETLGTDVLVYHGYVELFLYDRWVAATPAFNRELCERLGVAPLEFDGTYDSIFQAFDGGVGQFMEYLADHGSHVDIPFAAMFDAWALHYPAVREGRWPQPR